MNSIRRLYFALPLVYDDPDGFWGRDSALIVKGFRELGYEAFLVTLHSSSGNEVAPDPARPVITCSRAQLQDPLWWASLRPDAIILSLWGANRYDAIRKAALKCTSRVIERLDASGVRTPRIWPSYYYIQTWGANRDRGKGQIASHIDAFLRTAIGFFVRKALERPIALTMAQLPAVVAESPLAAARTERHIRWHSDSPVRVFQISNPVDTKFMNFGPDDVKTNTLVAVGRWDTTQKDFPLLIVSALDFLSKYRDWDFDIVGRGVEGFRFLIEKAEPDLRRRIRIHGSVPYSRVAEINRRAKIHFLVSRWEGFCNASVEALCCGCSYVGPVNIAASSYLIENRSGTIAPHRKREDLVDALAAEAEAWRRGRRDPVEIAARWTEESGYLAVSRRTLGILESIPIGR